MIKLSSILVAGVLAVIAVPAAAQQPAAPALTPAQPAAPPVSESHLAAARDVVIGSGLARTFEGMAPQIADQIRSGYSRTRPEIIKDMEEVLKPIIAELTKRSEQMITVSAQVYAQRLSEAELKEAAAFFKSASGQKYVNTQGQVMNELFSAMQVFSQTLGNVMVDMLRDELKKKNIQL